MPVGLDLSRQLILTYVGGTDMGVSKVGAGNLSAHRWGLLGLLTVGSSSNGSVESLSDLSVFFSGHISLGQLK